MTIFTDTLQLLSFPHKVNHLNTDFSSESHNDAVTGMANKLQEAVFPCHIETALMNTSCERGQL